MTMGSNEIVLPPRDSDDWSLKQLEGIIIATKTSAMLSTIASLVVIYLIVRPIQNRDANKTYLRIIFLLSLHDVLSSFAVFMSTWAAPRDNLHASQMPGCFGNWTTCEIQGFFISYGYSSCMIYNSLLSLYFLLFIKHGWKEEKFDNMKWPVLCFSFLLPFSFSLCMVVTKSINPGLFFCFLQSYPINCEVGDEYTCIRGENSILIQMVYVGGFVLLSSAVIIVSNLKLYFFVKKIERRSRRWSASSINKKQSKHSNVVFRKATWYVFAFGFIWWPTIVSFRFFILRPFHHANVYYLDEFGSKQINWIHKLLFRSN